LREAKYFGDPRRELTYAKVDRDILRIQMKFVRSQLELLASRLKTWGRLISKRRQVNEKAVSVRNNKPGILLRWFNRRE